jgi:hypothetical protein
MTALADPSAAAEVTAAIASGSAAEPGTRADVSGPVVYGDFSCPWSYLAFHRASALAAAGVPVAWRAVEHDHRPPDGHGDSSGRSAALREEADRVVGLLLPGERLPLEPVAFVPRTAPAVAAHAESEVAGVPWRVGRLLFESVWVHGIDIGSARTLRTLLAGELRGSHSPSEAVREWGYAVDVTGGPISTEAWRLVRRSAAEWLDLEKLVVPVLRLPGAAPLHGVDALEWLGAQVVARGLVPEPHESPDDVLAVPSDRRDVPALGWVAAHGGRWLRSFQDAAASARRTPAR